MKIFSPGGPSANEEEAGFMAYLALRLLMNQKHRRYRAFIFIVFFRSVA